ncbi:MAG: DNA polymerase IV [Clostridia bacterium]|nr:DNA polymerase IV [Clostridia bacterium]
MTDRAILHSDLNAFYASAEIVMHPEWQGRPVAVCGSVEDRHGIVLAKSQQAKEAGVRTGMVVREARALCPDLIVAEPHYDRYMTFSRLVRKIYARYSDLIEPFGMDECWIDVTGSARRWGTPVEIAERIRREVRKETGLTVSVGVSFNKVFAKLASDLKKPDAVTVIARENMKETVWPLPVSSLLYAGPATVSRLERFGIRTVGELAAANEETLRGWMGANAMLLMRFARGEDLSRVMRDGESMPVKSVGHGITCNADLYTPDEVRRVLLELSQDVGMRLKEAGLLACGISVCVKDNRLECEQFMSSLPAPTRSRREIAEAAYALFCRRYEMVRGVRAVTVTAIRPVREKSERQLDCFGDYRKKDRLDRLESAVDNMTLRFGAAALRPADVLTNFKTQNRHSYLSVLPHGVVK